MLGLGSPLPSRRASVRQGSDLQTESVEMLKHLEAVFVAATPGQRANVVGQRGTSSSGYYNLGGYATKERFGLLPRRQSTRTLWLR